MRGEGRDDGKSEEKGEMMGSEGRRVGSDRRREE